MLYYFIFTLIAIFAFIEQFGSVSKKDIRQFFYLFIGVLFCLSFLKWERGSDWESYYSIFYNGEQFAGDDVTEKGFLFFNKLIRLFTDSYTVYLFFQGAFYYSIYVILIKKINDVLDENTNKTCYFPILLYDFSIGFAGIFASRGKIAYLLCLFSVLYIYKGQLVRFLITIIIASTIHTTSLLFLLAYPLFRSKYTKWTVILFVIGVISLFMLGPSLEPFMNAYNYTRYSSYVESNESLSIVNFLKWGVVLLLAILLKYKKDPLLYWGCLKLYLTGFIIYIWCQMFAHFAQRIAGVYMSVIIFWIAMLFYKYNKNSRIIIFFVLVLYSAVSLYGLLNSEYRNLFIPFKFVWDSFSVDVF